jgi:CheY-like chemotaxis protein
VAGGAGMFLVIDDDQLARHFGRCSSASGAIVTAARADDALRVALIADVIVCGLASAEMTGSEFLSELQRLHVRLGRTVQTITLLPVGTRSARVRAAGFHAHLTKPVEGDDRKAAVLDRLRQ